MEGIEGLAEMQNAMEAANAVGSVGEAGAVLAFMGAYFFFIFIILAISLAIQWKVFTKAGQPGWAALIPIYNIYIMTQIVGRPAWWTLTLLFPPVFFFANIIMMLDLAKSFGKDIAFGVGLILASIIFMGILGFGSAEYQGPTQSFDLGSIG